MRWSDRYRLVPILGGLVLLQFSLRARLGDDRVAPDFLLLALLIYTIRAQPGRSAGAGFLVGLLRDALTPASFGAGALAHTLVGYLSSWGRSEEHTSELQSRLHLVCRLLLGKKKNKNVQELAHEV